MPSCVAISDLSGTELSNCVAMSVAMRAAMADVAETRLRMQHLDGTPERTGLDNLVVTTAGL